MSLINDCFLEWMTNDAEDIPASQISDDCSLKEDELFQFLYSPIQNTPACDSDEGLWEKSEISNNATRENNSITNVTVDTEKCKKHIENDWDAEMLDELTADIFQKEECIKDDLTWSSENSLELMPSPAQVEYEPMEEISKAGLVNTSNNLLLQPSLSPCASTVNTGQKVSILKINQQKSTLKTSSSSLCLPTVKKKTPTTKCVITSPHSLHAVTSNNSLLLVNGSDTVLPSSRKTCLKNDLLNTEQRQHFANKTQLLSTTRLKTKTLAKKTHVAKGYMLSQSALHAVSPDTVATVSPVKPGLKLGPHNMEKQCYDTNKTCLLSKHKLMKTEQVPNVKTVKPKTRCMIKNASIALANSSVTTITKPNNRETSFWVNMPSTSSDNQKLTNYDFNYGSKNEEREEKEGEEDMNNFTKPVTWEVISANSLSPDQLAANASSVSRKEQVSYEPNRNNSGETTHLSIASPVVEFSGRKNSTFRRGKQHSPMNSDGQLDLHEKRYKHNNSMKQQRQKFNTLVQELRTVVPSTEHNSRASKVLILQEAIKYCKEIPHLIEKQEKKMRKLQSQQKKLCNKLSLLQLEKDFNRMDHSFYTGIIQTKSEESD